MVEFWNMRDTLDIQKIMMVSSAKGGVGKSTLAYHLAQTLSQQGRLKVGLLDADIHGSSLPTLMGIQKTPLMEEGKFLPHTKGGVKGMSMGFLVDPTQPIVWRGLMVQKALRQFFMDVSWGSLDLLIIDMPPGTGDIPLTLSKWIPMDGNLVVSTSDPLALSDAVRGARMSQKMGVPLLGFVENMALVSCPQCGEEISLGAGSSVEDISKAEGLPFLGSLPFDINLRTSTSLGVNTQRAILDLSEKVQARLFSGSI